MYCVGLYVCCCCRCSCSRQSPSVVTRARGTPGFVAPEVRMGGKVTVTQKVDVYR